MDWICWAVPVKPGKTDVAREYCRALETTRRADYEASERELGIQREVFFLWTSPTGEDYIVLYMDGDDMTKSLDVWEAHTGEFETWGKGQWAEFCDSDELPKPLSAGPGNGPVLEVLSAYDATIHKTGKV